MRTPMPRYSAGHREVVGLEVEARLDREHHARLELAVLVDLAAGLRAVVHVEAEHVARAVHHVALVELVLGLERLLGRDREEAPLGGPRARSPASPRRAPRGTPLPGLHDGERGVRGLEHDLVDLALLVVSTCRSPGTCA